MKDENLTIVVLNEDAMNYLAELIEKNEFNIETDIYHGEYGVRELLKILKKEEILEDSFCKTALGS